MKYYIGIHLLPDPEFSSNVLMNALFSKLHRAFVKNGCGNIGISFPQENKTLGDTLRLHGSQSILEHFMSLGWLNCLTDYTERSGIMQVPDNCKYRCVRRVQVKSNLKRLYCCSVKNGRLTIEEAQEKINNSKEQCLKLPFVQIKSFSSDQLFRLFIHFQLKV